MPPIKVVHIVTGPPHPSSYLLGRCIKEKAIAEKNSEISIEFVIENIVLLLI